MGLFVYAIVINLHGNDINGSGRRTVTVCSFCIMQVDDLTYSHGQSEQASSERCLWRIACGKVRTGDWGSLTVSDNSFITLPELSYIASHSVHFASFSIAFSLDDILTLWWTRCFNLRDWQQARNATSDVSLFWTMFYQYKMQLSVLVILAAVVVSMPCLFLHDHRCTWKAQQAAFKWFILFKSSTKLY